MYFLLRDLALTAYMNIYLKNMSVKYLGLREPFDVWTDMDFAVLLTSSLSKAMARLVLVPNPDHHLQGDFTLDNASFIQPRCAENTYTFSGIALIHPQIIRSYPDKRTCFPLKEVFDYHIERQQLVGWVYDGKWCDVGTPERLASLEKSLLRMRES